MMKRKSRAEWLQAKAVRKVTARLLSELLLTRDDKLERFRMVRATAEARPDLQRLREVQAILVMLATAIQRGDDAGWSRIRLAWQLLVEGAGDGRPVPTEEPSQPVADSQPAADSPSDQAAEEPGELADRDAERRVGGLRKPNLADPAPAGRPSQPSGLPAPALPPRPARFAVPPVGPRAPETRAPIEAVRPSRDSDEHTDLRAVPNPQPVMPFRKSLPHPSPLPGRVAPPDPTVPAPPVGGRRAQAGAGIKPPWPGPDARPAQARGEETTGLTAVLDADAAESPQGPALPFAGPGLALLPIPADADDGDDVTDVLESPLQSVLGAPAAEPLVHDSDEAPTMLSGPGEPNPMAAAVRAHESFDWDELGRTPTWDELPWTAELGEASRDHGSRPSGLSGPPASAGDDPFQSSHAGVQTLVGQPPAFLARLQSITLDQYASVRAECELFPERIDEVRRVVGLQGNAEMTALDDLWRHRFAQSPALRSQFEQAVARYRVWLRQKGKD